MEISGRTAGSLQAEMKIKEVREGRATYYLVPFSFLIASIAFEFDFTPEGSIRPQPHLQNTIVASGVTLRAVRFSEQ